MNRNVVSFLESNTTLYRPQFNLENNGILPVVLFIVKNKQVKIPGLLALDILVNL